MTDNKIVLTEDEAIAVTRYVEKKITLEEWGVKGLEGFAEMYPKVAQALRHIHVQLRSIDVESSGGVKYKKNKAGRKTYQWEEVHG